MEAWGGVGGLTLPEVLTPSLMPQGDSASWLPPAGFLPGAAGPQAMASLRPLPVSEASARNIVLQSSTSQPS